MHSVAARPVTGRARQQRHVALTEPPTGAELLPTVAAWNNLMRLMLINLLQLTLIAYWAKNYLCNRARI